MGSYTIGEVATRSGFSPSALRYYEGIGLVEPATRTDAGYRVYDDDSLSRLAFIARAKQLGCTLDEITDLVGLWDGERCGPVQRHFLGVGAAACAACCAGPILAFLGGLGAAGLLSTLAIGVAGLAIAAVAFTAFLVVRRRRDACSTTGAEAVSLEPPARRSTVDARH